jgi:hypothetical protein
VFGLAAVRRERFLAAGGFDESLRYATDSDLWARLILDGARVGAVMEPLARYRLHEDSLSGKRAKLFAGRVRVLEQAAAHPSLSPVEREIVAESLAVERRLALAAARAALAGPRRRSVAVALGPGTRSARASRPSPPPWPLTRRPAGSRRPDKERRQRSGCLRTES